MKSLERSKRLPANYRLVYDVVRAQQPGCHSVAAEVLARARKLKSGLGHSTVYRALDRLRDLGLILEVHVPGMKAALYEPARANHAHFVCRICGAIKDIDCALPISEIRALVEGREGAADEISLTVLGRCARCRGLPAAVSGFPI